MTKVWPAIIAVVCCVLAGVLVTVAERDENVSYVPGSVGQTLAMTDTERAVLEEYVVTRQLRDGETFLGRSRDVYLVAKITIYVEQNTGYSWDAYISTGERTFKAAEAVSLPASGFKMTVLVPIELPEDALRGARFRLYQRGMFKAFETALDFDLDIDDPGQVQRRDVVNIDRQPKEEVL